MLTVVVASNPPAPFTTMCWVDEPAVASSPTARSTATTVPAIGLTMVACAIACSAAVTSAAAASTAAW